MLVSIERGWGRVEESSLRVLKGGHLGRPRKGVCRCVDARVRVRALGIQVAFFLPTFFLTESRARVICVCGKVQNPKGNRVVPPTATPSPSPRKPVPVSARGRPSVCAAGSMCRGGGTL